MTYMEHLAMEHGQHGPCHQGITMIDLSKMVLFHSYVKAPEGNQQNLGVSNVNEKRGREEERERERGKERKT